MRRPRLRAAVLVVALALAGCASDESAGAPNVGATLLLDSPPNAIHTGIYMAVDRGYDTGLGVDLRVRTPSDPTDAAEQLVTGRADLAILGIHDLALARERGRDVVGVMALVQTPLAAVLAQPPNRTPRDLAGKRVGVTGRPGDAAV
ncbi:MAG: ABC transporter substrate-binding protein, partial [Solirubrobacteraceae bacterium]